ncbi:ribonuclease VapC [Rhizobium mesoamericanum]|uniref:type II toxin-antitoxin system VapC family toxin n=1 Tax=Rhizobium mesoamericanum TaxID=1079800 RepID=UPI002783FCF7|nr:type II toxin-antitoxin system VapC family toxin [Rhizobium mesoamericanum]MDQ0563599.1 ribonuclease VapC [Rhizobium mesoamericanum]
MVIDTSAVVAIAFSEPEAEAFEAKIVDAPRRFMSAASVLELAIVIEARMGEAGAAELDLWLHKAGVEIVSVDTDQITLARRAWRAFGKGRHPAGLNYGDCFSYALAKSRGEPLLFKGDDFSRTDVVSV